MVKVLSASDPDGNPLTYRIFRNARYGFSEIKRDTDGVYKLFYTSLTKFYDTDRVTFMAEDGDCGVSNFATITINFVNRAPVAQNGSINTFTGNSEVKTVFASDPDKDDLTYRIIANATYGQSEIRRDTDGSFRLYYTSLPKFYDNDKVTFVAEDGRGGTSNVATITIKFVNRAPVAQDASYTVASGALLDKYIFASDPDRNDLTYRIVNNAKHGTNQIRRDAQGNWRLSYTSVVGYSGPDVVTFVATDSAGLDSNVATVNISVTASSPMS